MRHYRKFRRLLLLLTITSCLAGCAPVFLNPISDPDRAETDKRLLGRWKGTDKGNTNDYMRFEATSDTQMNVSLFNKKEPKHKPFLRFFPTRLEILYTITLVSSTKIKARGT